MAAVAAGLLLGMQADDLTGGSDSGAPFATRGLETVVLLPGARLPVPPVPVVVLDTESRTLRAQEARRRARAAARRLAAGHPATLYKKLDSTLRGHVAAELAGMLDGAGVSGAVVAPAFPAQGRTVVDGRLRIDAGLAGDRGAASGPGRPPTGDSVLALLAAAGEVPAGVLPLATLRRGAGPVQERLARWARLGGRALVADAETDADLATLAEAAAADRGSLLAGSAGLATALAARLSPGGAPVPVVLAGPLLVVAGSAHPATAAQVAALQARRAGGLRLADPGAAPRDVSSARGRGAAAWVIAATPPGATPPRARQRAMARRLALLAAERIARVPPGTVVLTGGDVAAAVCRALRARGLRLRGEVEPGLAVGALLDGPHAGLVVVTKAGGFGDAGALVRVLEACA